MTGSEPLEPLVGDGEVPVFVDVGGDEEDIMMD